MASMSVVKGDVIAFTTDHEQAQRKGVKPLADICVGCSCHGIQLPPRHVLPPVREKKAKTKIAEDSSSSDSSSSSAWSDSEGTGGATWSESEVAEAEEAPHEEADSARMVHLGCIRRFSVHLGCKPMHRHFCLCIALTLTLNPKP